MTNTATKNVRTVVTDSVGEYVLPNLDAGIYRITMTLSGFAAQTSETELLARQTVRVDVQLQLAGAKEQLEVVAANPVIGSLHGPKTSVFSMTLGKSFNIVGQSRARFEAAFSNLFNIENLGVANTTVTSSNFGRITSTQPGDQAGPRTIQFSLRYWF